MTKEQKEANWSALTKSTIKHQWFCDCRDCLERNRIGQELIKVYQTEFEQRRVRIEAARG